MSVSMTEGTSNEPPARGIIRVVLFALALIAVIGVSIGLSNAFTKHAASVDWPSAPPP